MDVVHTCIFFDFVLYAIVQEARPGRCLLRSNFSSCKIHHDCKIGLYNVRPIYKVIPILSVGRGFCSVAQQYLPRSLALATTSSSSSSSQHCRFCKSHRSTYNQQMTFNIVTPPRHISSPANQPMRHQKILSVTHLKPTTHISVHLLPMTDWQVTIARSSYLFHTSLITSELRWFLYLQHSC